MIKKGEMSYSHSKYIKKQTNQISSGCIEDTCEVQSNRKHRYVIGKDNNEGFVVGFDPTMLFLYFTGIIATFIGVAAVRGTSLAYYLHGYAYLALFLQLFLGFLCSKNDNTIFSTLSYWYIFLAAIILSMLINQDYKDALNILILCLTIYFMRRMSQRALWISLYAIVVSYIPMGMLFSHEGPTNSNAVSFAFVFFIILIWLTKRDFSWIIISCFIALTSIALVTLDSRTAFISYGFCSILLLYIHINISNRIVLKQYVILLLLLIILTVGSMTYDRIMMFVRDKWTSQGYNVDITTHRSEMWTNELVNHWTFFGGGASYFSSNYHHGDAHNIIIQVFGRYGLVAFLTFFMAIIHTIIQSIYLIRKKRHWTIPICFLFCLLVGLFENILFVDQKMYLPSVVFICLLGLLDKEICEGEII